MTNYSATSNVGAIWGLSMVIQSGWYPMESWGHRIFLACGLFMIAMSYLWARVAD